MKDVNGYDMAKISFPVEVRGEWDIDFCTQCAIMTIAVVELSLMMFWNSEQLSNLKGLFASLIFI